MGEHRPVSGSGSELSAREVVGRAQCYAANLRRELRGRSRWAQLAGTGRTRAAECPVDSRLRFLMRRFPLLLVAIFAAGVFVSACQGPATQNHSRAVPSPDPARAAQLPPTDLAEGRRLCEVKC